MIEACDMPSAQQCAGGLEKERAIMASFVGAAEIALCKQWIRAHLVHPTTPIIYAVLGACIADAKLCIAVESALR